MALTHWIKRDSLFYLRMPLKYMDSHIIGYWISSIWSLWHFFRRSLLLSHRLLFRISTKGSFMHFPKDMSAFDTPVVDHWLKRKIAKTANASAKQDRFPMQTHPNIYFWVLYWLSYVPLFDSLNKSSFTKPSSTWQYFNSVATGKNISWSAGCLTSCGCVWCVW